MLISDYLQADRFRRMAEMRAGIEKLGMLQKLGVVAAALKAARRLAFFKELVRRRGGAQGLKVFDIPGVSDERKFFEIRQLTRGDLHKRLLAVSGHGNSLLPKINPVLHKRMTTNFEAARVKRLEGGRQSVRHIFTDGSFLPKTRSGAVAYSTNGGAPRSFLIRAVDPHDAERQAVVMAIKNAPSNFRGNLYTDSMNVLANKDIRWQAWQKRIGLRKIKAHVANAPNKPVDLAARLTLIKRP